jgi:hypothetical protein
MESRCDKCGEYVSDIDAGFSPGLHEMGHGGCGGTWRCEPDYTDEYEAHEYVRGLWFDE